MLPISRILAPVDFSSRCLGMIPTVKGFAARYQAEVVLLHVVNPFYSIPPTGLSGPAMIPVPQSVIAERAKQMDAFAVHDLRGVTVRRFVYEGDPASQIVAMAQAEQVHLIAMPTHGYGIFRRFLIGSVTAKVLHDAVCPVLTGVHMEEPTHEPGGSIRNILCAVDLGPASRDTLSWAARLASDFGARLSIVHAITPVDPGVVVLLSSDFQLEVERLARQELEKLQRAAGVEAAGVTIEEGEAAKTVCASAKAMGADLLVIGRGVPEGQAGRLRTTAYAIIRQSPCPVISV